MTYLELVNGALRRLRESEVSTVSETAYSKMAGDFINDAKKIVQSSWDWSQLRTVVTVNTMSSTSSYALTGLGSYGRVLYGYNDTSNCSLNNATAAWMEEQLNITDSPATGSPTYYTFNGVNASGDPLVNVFPIPDGVYSLRFTATDRNDDLSSDSDTLSIPSDPVLHLAIALLARERGETGGTSTAEYFAIADKYLSDAIAIDSAKHPEMLVWSTP